MLKIFLLLLLIATIVMIMPLTRKTNIYKKIIASIVIAFLFSWTTYVFIGLYQENTANISQVEITALDIKNELAEGTETVFRGAMIDGKWYHATQLCKNYSWLNKDEFTLLWRNYDQPDSMKNSISFELPSGKEKQLIFDSNKWQGKVKVVTNGDEIIFDCFSGSEQTKDIGLVLPDITYVPDVLSNIAIFCLMFIISFLIFLRLAITEKFLDVDLKPREIWGDILRIICVFTVIWLHCTNGVYLPFSPSDPQWFSKLYLNSFTTFAVPCFFMVSGAFLLRKKQDIKVVWMKRLPKLFVPLLFWSFCYILIDIYIWKDGRGFWVSLLKSLFVEQYWHLWFIYSIAGLYILLPIISSVYQLLDQKLKCYLLFIILILPGILHDLFIIMGKDIFVPGFALFYPALGLFIFGQFIWEHQDHLPRQHWLYGILFFIGLAITVLGTYFISIRAGSPMKDLFSNGSVGVLIMAVALFMWCLKMESQWQKWSTKIKQQIGYIGKLTVGIYFIHMFVMLFIGNHIKNSILGVSANSGSMLNMFFGAIVYFFVSMIVCWCGSQIPIIGVAFGNRKNTKFCCKRWGVMKKKTKYEEN